MRNLWKDYAMVVIDGKFDGKQVVFDKPPEGLAPGTKVRVISVEEGRSTGLAAIAAMAIEGGLPPDFAAQHHHYTKGLPKR
jgi:hypothetical protein